MNYENVVFIHNGTLLSHEEDEILSFPGKWMELENIILSEVSQAQKVKNLMFSPVMQIIDIKQMQAYYGTWIILRGDFAQEG
jgi:hypothetical protein